MHTHNSFNPLSLSHVKKASIQLNHTERGFNRITNNIHATLFLHFHTHAHCCNWKCLLYHLAAASYLDTSESNVFPVAFEHTRLEDSCSRGPFPCKLPSPTQFACRYKEKSFPDLLHSFPKYFLPTSYTNTGTNNGHYLLNIMPDSNWWVQQVLLRYHPTNVST